MRRKSSRNTTKSSPEKPKEKQAKKPRRYSRRNRHSTSESGSEEDTPLQITETAETKTATSDHEDSQTLEDAMVANPKTSLEETVPTTPERSSKRLRLKTSNLADESVASPEEKITRRSRRRVGSPKKEGQEEDIEEKKGKGKSKGKNKSKLDQPLQISENEMQSEISENVQVTAQSPQFDKVDNKDADSFEHGLNQLEDDQNKKELDKSKDTVDVQEVDTIELPGQKVEDNSLLGNECKNNEIIVKDIELPEEKELKSSDESASNQQSSDKCDNTSIKEINETDDQQETDGSKVNDEVHLEERPLKQENDSVINNRHEENLTEETKVISANEDNNRATIDADTNIMKDDNTTPSKITLDKKLESTNNSISVEIKEINAPDNESETDDRKNIPQEQKDTSNEEDTSDGNKDKADDEKDKADDEKVKPDDEKVKADDEKDKADDEKDQPLNEKDEPDNEKDKSETSFQSEEITVLEAESKVESVEHVITETIEDSQVESNSIESKKEENILELNLEIEENVTRQEANSESNEQIRQSEPEDIQTSVLAAEASKSIDNFDKTEELHDTKKNNEKVTESIRNIALNRKRCSEDFTDTENLNLCKSSTQNRKKWGRSSVGLKSYNLIEISTDMFKNVYPDMTLSEEHDLKLDVLLHKEQQSSISEDSKKLDKNSFSEKPYTREVSDDGVDNIIAMNRKISIVDDDASKLRPPPSPAKNDKSDVLFITNLVRPFTLKQLKELLERTGRIIEDGFWTDKIKSKCYVQYESVEDAEATRNALHGVHWPICNGKKLNIEYATQECLEKARNPPPNVVIPKAIPEKENQEPVPQMVKRVQSEPREDMDMVQDSSDHNIWNKNPIKEVVHVERGKSKDRSDKRKYSRSHLSRSPSQEYTKKKPKKVEESIPQRAMDDLFKKTETTPCIYWQPLSPEEIALKQQQRLERMAEHKRRMETQTRNKRGPDHSRGGPYRRRY